MGLIIKDKIPMFIEGYPTVSDKYNVAGGILDGEKAVKFGQLVQYADKTGYYKAIDAYATGDMTKVAGIVLGTNVKLADYTTDEVRVEVGEAFNLLIDGFVAVALGAGATEADIKPNAAVCINSKAEFTTTNDSDDKDTFERAAFTGMYEKHGDVIVAEIYIK